MRCSADIRIIRPIGRNLRWTYCVPISAGTCPIGFARAGKGSNPKEPYAERNFHVAIWHKDLIELHDKGYVWGVEGVLTEREWYDRFLSSMPPGPYFIKLSDGTLKEVELAPDRDRDDTTPFAARIAREGLRVSSTGLSRATSLLADLEDDFKSLGDRVPSLLAQGYFDTAVREACIGIESRIKSSIGSKAWGDALANEFIADLRKNNRFLESYLRVLRGQLRTALKFIRNDVMHNFLSMNETECRAILLRLVRVRSQIESVCADMPPSLLRSGLGLPQLLRERFQRPRRRLEIRGLAVHHVATERGIIGGILGTRRDAFDRF